MVQKPVLVAVLTLALASIACSLLYAGQDAPVGHDSGSLVSGEQIFMDLGCSGCHDGAAGNIAPSLDGIFGSEVVLENGEKVVADEDYLRESILSPTTKIVNGFRPVMPDMSHMISDEELDALIDYLRSL